MVFPLSTALICTIPYHTMPQQTCGLHTMEGGIEKKKPDWTPSRATEGLPSKACISTFSAPDSHKSDIIITSCKPTLWMRMKTNMSVKCTKQIRYCLLMENVYSCDLDLNSACIYVDTLGHTPMSHLSVVDCSSEASHNVYQRSAGTNQ